MKFGGLSENELTKIISFLENKGIEFEVLRDESVEESNEYSMKNDLRHLDSPSISTHILAIEIPDETFSKIDEDTKKFLLQFGITTDIPQESEFNYQSNPVNDLHNSQHNRNNKVIGLSLFQIIVIGVFFILSVLVLKSQL